VRRVGQRSASDKIEPMNKLKLTIILAVASLGLCLPASAGLVFDNTGLPGNQNHTQGGGPFKLGLDFTVNNSFEVNTLGLFDANGDGFGSANIPVAIFDLATGAPVASYTFTGAADALVGGSRIHSIAPVTLLADKSYSIVAIGLGTDANPNWNGVFSGAGAVTPTFDSQGGALSFTGQWRFDYLSHLIPLLPQYVGQNPAFPVFGAGTFGYIEPENITAVPEPSTYLAGLSALGMLVFGWRNRK